MTRIENVVCYPVTKEKADWLKTKVRDIPDYPKPGIIFKDLTPLFREPEALAFVIDALSTKVKELNPTRIVGIEARGFILGPTIAYKLGLGFVPIRKPGKLPYKTEQVSYSLEYGTGNLEIHIDSFEKGERAVVIDDLLATGGTALAACKLVKKLGAEVLGVGFIVSLDFLNGRQKLPSNLEVFSLIQYS
jgi:adenine phosphoribosyltransferase